VVLNYPEQSIHLKPNSHFNEGFDYSYTGLGIYQIDGEIRVVDVMPGSPGDKAGFLPGDVIFSVETNASKNIQAYKTSFKTASAKCGLWSSAIKNRLFLLWISRIFAR
jgi:C-terminal processing protease CtpA/Prc